jgi:tRNA(Ile)-lysidine synthase
MRVQERLLAYVRKHELMRAGDRVGVAVSGGADSVALLRLLLELRHELGIVLAVVHFNHKLRGEASDADEEFVRALASEHDLEFFCQSGDTRKVAAEHGCGIEAAARKLRYEFFWRLMDNEAAAEIGGGVPHCTPRVHTSRSVLDRIATAHTMDDQAETVVMRFARGAGTRGLAGIHPLVWYWASGAGVGASADPNNKSPEPDVLSPKPAIVRPLLEFRRAQLRHYLKRAGQAWREDISNQDVAFARNNVRQEVMPKLRELNPAIEQVLSETAEIARAEEEYWREVVSGALEGLTTQDTDGYGGKQKVPRLGLKSSLGMTHQKSSTKSLKLTDLLRIPLALRRRVVREFAAQRGLRLEFHHVQQVLEAAAEDPTRRERRVELPGDWDACLAGNELRLQHRTKKKEHRDYEFPLPVPGEVRVEAAGVKVRACLSEVLPRLKVCELTVRNWRPGDRYWPAHSGSEKKVKELLQDRRVPPEARANWPVVVAAQTGQIIWVPGFAYAEGSVVEAGPGVVLEMGAEL